MKNYQRGRQALRERLSQHACAPQQLKGVPTVAHLRATVGTSFNGLDAGANEFWLWHGTKPPTADILATSGFDERVAALRGLYGAGNYFADAFCKSNQYATETNARGEHCVLYCRVTVGCAYRTARLHRNARRPPDNDATPGAPHDSIFAESGVANGGQQAHNEFVCFSKEQVYVIATRDRLAIVMHCSGQGTRYLSIVYPAIPGYRTPVLLAQPTRHGT